MGPGTLGCEVGEKASDTAPLHRRRAEGGAEAFAALPPLPGIGQAEIPAMPLREEATPYATGPDLTASRPNPLPALHRAASGITDVVPTHPLRAGTKGALPEARVLLTSARRQAAAAQVRPTDVLLATRT